MIDRIRAWLGFASPAGAAELDEVVDFCSALTDQFSDRFPPQFEHSLLAASAWWAIALYVQFPIMTRARRFNEADWQAASLGVADRMMARLFPDFPEDGPEKADLRDALQGHVYRICKLWIAALGFAPKLESLRGADQMSDRLMALFGNEQLALRSQLDLPENQDQDEDGDKDLEIICTAFAIFFDICSRSHP